MYSYQQVLKRYLDIIQIDEDLILLIFSGGYNAFMRTLEKGRMPRKRTFKIYQRI